MMPLNFPPQQRRKPYPMHTIPYSFHGLVGLTRSIPFDIEKAALQAIEIKAEILESAV